MEGLGTSNNTGLCSFLGKLQHCLSMLFFMRVAVVNSTVYLAGQSCNGERMKKVDLLTELWINKMALYNLTGKVPDFCSL